MIRILLKRKVLLIVSIMATAILIGLHIFHDVENKTGHIRQLGTDNGNQPLIATIKIPGAHRVQDNITVSNDIHYSALPQKPLYQNELTTASQDSSTKARMLAHQMIFNKNSVPALPGVFTYLPHLASRPEWLAPKTEISKGRSNVSIVIGIPSIRRPMGIYIFNTLQSLFSGMNEQERNDTVIILCIAEPWNETYETQVIDQLKVNFHAEISQGLLDIITPKAEFYPDLTHLKPTLGDNQDRVKWRSKQNLDYAFLILHAWSRGQYYLQLEDDLNAVPGFITSMKNAIEKNYWDWFSLEFSTLGFIGRLFRSEDALKMMEFLLMFYSNKPCDWLYDDYLQVRMCGHGEKWSKCLHKIQNVARSIKPSLFQHEGLRSSLGGTLNKLKDKAFGATPSIAVYNPPVENIITTLQTYSKYDIFNAYNGHDIFWGSNPKEGDIIDFLFDVPIPLAKVYIETGNQEHPGDIIRNATLEILPQKILLESSPLYTKKISNGVHGITSQQKLAYEQRLSSNPGLAKLATNDTFYGVGEFDNIGVASVDIPAEAGKIWVLRVHIHATSLTWVVIKKINLTLEQTDLMTLKNYTKKEDGTTTSVQIIIKFDCISSSMKTN